MKPKRIQRLDAPLGILSNGTLVANIAHLNEADVAIQPATVWGRPLFVGVALTPGEARKVLHDLDDALAEIVSRFGAAVHGTRRPR